MGSLVVYIKDNVRTSQIWKKTGDQGSAWQKGRVTLKSASNFKVIHSSSWPHLVIESLGTENGNGGKQNHLFVLYTSQRIHY